MKTNLLLVCLSLSACQGLVGSGTIVTQERDVPAFRKLHIASGIDAKATTGTRAVSIRTDDNVQAQVETFVQGDTLIVRLKPNTLLAVGRIDASLSNDVFEGVEASGGSTLTVPASPIPHIDVAASGGSEIHVSSLSSEDFTVEASGGSDVTLEGSALRGTAEASGGSKLRLTQVPLESLDVEASGGSEVNARVSSKLTGSASGGSTVTIVGIPDSRVERSGASEVRLGAP